jgi:signal transduction histidine kinase
MTPEQQALLFQRYQRVLPDHVNIPGTGIGLFSVKRIVDAHGGMVSVHSEPGKGSTFMIRIPAHQDNGRPVPTAR